MGEGEWGGLDTVFILEFIRLHSGSVLTREGDIELRGEGGKRRRVPCCHATHPPLVNQKIAGYPAKRNVGGCGGPGGRFGGARNI